ncbi:myeloid leukemia factor 1 isoform X8 [Ascaphus truei]|uniref:myeloid leukemia factor 1 isoform X8 n=1 Tax=Ascaphus truei TaxID=8439 RepID=UPI003F5A7311
MHRLSLLPWLPACILREAAAAGAGQRLGAENREHVRQPAPRLRRGHLLFASSLSHMPFDAFTGMEGLSERPDTHSFRSSSVMTYSKTGDEPAKVFQATSQTRKAPGGIKETKRSVRDSESGVEKIAVGHHIKDRAHVVKKSNNKKTGDQELNQEFLNLDESEAPLFDDEWQREISKFMPTGRRSRIDAPKHKSVHSAALTGPAHVSRRERSITKIAL